MNYTRLLLAFVIALVIATHTLGEQWRTSPAAARVDATQAVTAMSLGRDVTVGVISGVVAGVVLAGLVLLSNYIHSVRREIRVRKALGHTGSGMAMARVQNQQLARALTVTLNNDTPIDLVIRAVALVQDGGGEVILNYLGPKEFGVQPRLFYETDDRMYAELPAFTKGRWGMAEDSIRKPSYGRMSGLVIVAKYVTIFGRPKVIRISSGESTLNPVVANWNRCLGKSGNS